MALTSLSRGSAMPSVSEQLARQLATPGYDSAVLVSPHDLTDSERQALPPWWSDVVLLGADEAMEVAVAQWNAALPGKLPRFLALLQEHSAGLYLARIGARGDRVVLIYALNNSSAEYQGEHPFVCWYGQPPTERLVNGRIDVERLPQSVRTIYTALHDHLRVAAFGATGFILSYAMFALDIGSSDLEYDTDGVYQPDPADLVTLLLSAHGNLCVELTDGTDDDDATGWLSYDSTLEDVGPLWHAIDEKLIEFSRPFN
jgi:hypothetical protein